MNESNHVREAEKTVRPPTFKEAFWIWVKVALLSFGGPAGQIAVMHRILVDQKRWIGETRFLHALNYCMLLPGPEAQQLATYIGWLFHKTRGGLVAGGLFVLPGFISILALSYLYAGFQNAPLVQALFFGLKPAVLAIVVEAIFRIGRRALKNTVMVGLAALAFIGIFFLNLPFPAIIFFAALIGFTGGWLRPDTFLVIKGETGKNPGQKNAAVDQTLAAGGLEHIKPSFSRALKVLAVCAVLWFSPIVVLAALFGLSDIYVREAIFFSKAAVVTFGGAYAVLAYIGQQAVHTYGWLEPTEMLDGLGMAETTPGPLIQVVQFVGFMGAYRNPGGLDPMVAGTLAAILVTWVTFVPCFLWIFLGAPYIEALRGNKFLSSALSAITAAVVGVIANLAVWFAIHTIFGEVEVQTLIGLRLLIPAWDTIDIAALILAVSAMITILRLKWGMISTLAASTALGMLYHLLLRA